MLSELTTFSSETNKRVFFEASELNHHDNIDENIPTGSTADPFSIPVRYFPL